MIDSTTPTPTRETGSHDAAMAQFLDDLIKDGADIEALLARAVALDPGRAEEFRDLVQGYRRLRGLRDPERLGPDRGRRLLAVGGMGRPYEAEEDDLRRVVAVKTIKFGRTAEPHLLERFDRERRTLARLHHTNIVPIYATGQ